jgi:hypothetical protein
MWKHKESKWLVRGGRKVKCYLCGKKILAKGDLFLSHQDTGYYSHQSCQSESTTISGNERRKAVKKIAVGAAVVGAIAAGAGKLIDISSQSKGSNSPAAQTILTSQGLIPPALTSDPSNPVPGQMWYRSDAGVMAHFDAVQNRVVYSSEINDGNVHVTSKGIVNGLSVLPNDGTGWFGPDTTKGATAPGQYGSPYTETVGIQEMVTFCFGIGGGTMVFQPGSYVVTDASLQTDPISGFSYKIAIPKNSLTNPVINLSFVSLAKAGFQLNSTQDQIDGTGNVFIKSLENDTGTTQSAYHFIMGAFTTGTNTSDVETNIGTYFDGIFFETSSESTNSLGGLDVRFVGDASFGEFLAKTYPDGPSPSSYNSSTGLYWMTGGGHFAGINADMIAISGYHYGIITDLPHTHVGLISLVYCQYGVVTYGGSVYGGQIDFFQSEQTPNEILLGNNTVSWHISSYSMGDQSTSGVFEYSYSIIDNGTSGGNVIIIDLFTLGTSGLTPAFNIVGKDVINIQNFGINDTGNPYIPSPTLSTNPPVSGTAYQNTNPYDIRLKIPVTYSPTSSAAATLATGTSSSSTVTTSTKVSYPAGITTGIIDTYEMVVPAGQYFELVVTNATIGTVEVQAA